MFRTVIGSGSGYRAFSAGVIAVATIASLAARAAEAAVVTWDGGGTDTNWSTGLNWTGTPDNTPPGTGDDATFPNITAWTAAVLDTDAVIGKLTMAKTGTIDAGSGTLTINGGIAQTSGTGSIKAPLVIGAPQSWTLSSNTGLSISGSISGNSQVKITYLNGAGHSDRQ